MYDFNDAEKQRDTSLIPDGTFALVDMTLRPGGVDGDNPADAGLLKASKSSDALLLDAEFVVVSGPYAKRRIWQYFVVKGGKVDENGVSIGWNITKASFRAMIDSFAGLDPDDETADAQQKRQIASLSEMSGITFAARIGIQDGGDYPDKNTIEHIVVCTEDEWSPLTNGQEVDPKPTGKRSSSKGATKQQQTSTNQTNRWKRNLGSDAKKAASDAQAPPENSDSSGKANWLTKAKAERDAASANS